MTQMNLSTKQKHNTYDITYMWNLKYDTNELVYGTETDSQTQRTDMWLQRVREERIGTLGLADANYYLQDG